MDSIVYVHRKVRSQNFFDFNFLMTFSSYFCAVWGVLNSLSKNSVKTYTHSEGPTSKNIVSNYTLQIRCKSMLLERLDGVNGLCSSQSLLVKFFPF